MWWDLGGDIPPHRKAAPHLGLRCFVVGVVASFPRTGRSYPPESPFLTTRFPTVFKPPHPTTWPKAPPLLGWSVGVSRENPAPSTGQSSERFGAFRLGLEGGFWRKFETTPPRPEKPQKCPAEKRGCAGIRGEIPTRRGPAQPSNGAGWPPVQGVQEKRQLSPAAPSGSAQALRLGYRQAIGQAQKKPLKAACWGVPGRLAAARFRASATVRQLDKLDVLDQSHQAIVLDHIGLIHRLEVVHLVSAWLLLDEAAQRGLLVVDREVAQGSDQQLGVREERRVTMRDTADQAGGKDAVQCQLAGVVRGVRDIAQGLGVQQVAVNQHHQVRPLTMVRGQHLHGGIDQPVKVRVVTSCANRDLAQGGARCLHLARGLGADFLQPTNVHVLEQREGIAVGLLGCMRAVEADHEAVERLTLANGLVNALLEVRELCPAIKHAEGQGHVEFRLLTAVAVLFSQVYRVPWRTRVQVGIGAAGDGGANGDADSLPIGGSDAHHVDVLQKRVRLLSGGHGALLNSRDCGEGVGRARHTVLGGGLFAVGVEAFAGIVLHGLLLVGVDYWLLGWRTDLPPLCSRRAISIPFCGTISPPMERRRDGGGLARGLAYQVGEVVTAKVAQLPQHVAKALGGQQRRDTLLAVAPPQSSTGRADRRPGPGNLHDNFPVQLLAHAGSAAVLLRFHLQLHAALNLLVDLALVGVPRLGHFLPGCVGLFCLGLQRLGGLDQAVGLLDGGPVGVLDLHIGAARLGEFVVLFLERGRQISRGSVVLSDLRQGQFVNGVSAQQAVRDVEVFQGRAGLQLLGAGRLVVAQVQQHLGCGQFGGRLDVEVKAQGQQLLDGADFAELPVGPVELLLLLLGQVPLLALEVELRVDLGPHLLHIQPVGVLDALAAQHPETAVAGGVLQEAVRVDRGEEHATPCRGAASPPVRPARPASEKRRSRCSHGSARPGACPHGSGGAAPGAPEPETMRSCREAGWLHDGRHGGNQPAAQQHVAQRRVLGLDGGEERRQPVAAVPLLGADPLAHRGESVAVGNRLDVLAQAFAWHRVPRRDAGQHGQGGVRPVVGGTAQPGHVQFHRLGDQVVASAHLVRLHERLQVLDGVQRAVLGAEVGEVHPARGRDARHVVRLLGQCLGNRLKAMLGGVVIPVGAHGWRHGHRQPRLLGSLRSRALRVIVGSHPAQLAGKRTAYRCQVARAEGHHHSRPGGSPYRGPGGVALDQPGFAIALDPAESALDTPTHDEALAPLGVDALEVPQAAFGVLHRQQQLAAANHRHAVLPLAILSAPEPGHQVSRCHLQAVVLHTLGAQVRVRLGCCRRTPGLRGGGRRRLPALLAAFLVGGLPGRSLSRCLGNLLGVAAALLAARSARLAGTLEVTPGQIARLPVALRLAGLEAAKAPAGSAARHPVGAGHRAWRRPQPLPVARPGSNPPGHPQAPPSAVHSSPERAPSCCRPPHTGLPARQVAKGLHPLRCADRPPGDHQLSAPRDGHHVSPAPAFFGVVTGHHQASARSDQASRLESDRAQVVQAEARPRGHAHVMQSHSAGPIDRHSQGLALLITACRHRAAGRRAPNGHARLGDVPRDQPHALEGTAHAQGQDQRPLARLPELHRGNAMVDQVGVLRIRPAPGLPDSPRSAGVSRGIGGAVLDLVRWWGQWRPRLPVQTRGWPAHAAPSWSDCPGRRPGFSRPGRSSEPPASSAGTAPGEPADRLRHQANGGQGRYGEGAPQPRPGARLGIGSAGSCRPPGRPC
ncbi:unnamed protein product [Wuchereria bancrofti]|uniref:Uncharacterized protein n=1 Tax=Wuchereria bancrofti TaxID=6293 RepID=A0A3P7FFB4_WUCBA|nr:unnamed protein product [Wuchereria bancrofti]